MISGEIVVGGRELFTEPRVADKLETVLVMYSMTNDLKMIYEDHHKNIIFEFDESRGFKYRLKIKYDTNGEIKSILFIKMSPIQSFKKG